MTEGSGSCRSWSLGVLALLALLGTAPDIGRAQGMEDCTDAIDNDGDGLIDCEDLDCTDDPACPEICDNAIDDDADAKVLDLDLYGTVNFGSHVGAQLGYRSLTADYLFDEDAGDLELKGWYFGGLLRF